MAKPPRQAKSTKSENKSDAQQRREVERRNRDKYLRDLAKQRDKELRSFIKAARGTGVYDIKRPEGKTFANMPLSKGQRYRANKALKEFGDFFDPAKFVLLIPEKKARKNVRSKAEGLNLKTTKLGFFAPREGYQKVTLVHDKKRDEYAVKKSGKTKRGQNKGKRYAVITPLVSADQLDEERDRLIHLAQQIKLSGKERLAYEVRENGHEGYSHKTFSNIDELMRYLEGYQKNVAARTNFYRHIHIVKTASFRQWAEEHPVRARVGGFGRSIYARTKLDRQIRKKNG